MNARLQLQIYTQDHAVAHAIFGDNLKAGQQVVIGEGLEAEFKHVEGRREIGWPDIVALVFTVSMAVPPSVAANLITTWLLSKIPRQPEKIMVDRIEVEWEEGELKRVFSERIERTRG